MSNMPFQNDTDQETRRQVERYTFLTRAQSEVDQVGGRYKKEIATTVNAIPKYPSLPASSPWSDPANWGPDEPSLGFSVDEMPANGTPAEIEASLAAVPTPVATPSAEVGDCADEEPVASAANLAAVLAAGSSTIKRRE